MIVSSPEFKFISVKIPFSTCKGPMAMKTRVLPGTGFEICPALSVRRQTKKADFSTQLLSTFSNSIPHAAAMRFLFFSNCFDVNDYQKSCLVTISTCHQHSTSFRLEGIWEKNLMVSSKVSVIKCAYSSRIFFVISAWTIRTSSANVRSSDVGWESDSDIECLGYSNNRWYFTNVVSRIWHIAMWWTIGILPYTFKIACPTNMKIPETGFAV